MYASYQIYRDGVCYTACAGSVSQETRTERDAKAVELLRLLIEGWTVGTWEAVQRSMNRICLCNAWNRRRGYEKLEETSSHMQFFHSLLFPACTGFATSLDTLKPSARLFTWFQIRSSALSTPRRSASLQISLLSLVSSFKITYRCSKAVQNFASQRTGPRSNHSPVPGHDRPPFPLTISRCLVSIFSPSSSH